MRKWIFPVLAVLIVFIIIILYYIFSPKSPISPFNENFTSPEGNETQTPWEFPIKFPWSPVETGETEGGAGGMGAGGAGGEGGGTGGGEENETIILENHTLFVDSPATPELNVSVIYNVNDAYFNEIKSLPFSLEIQKNTYACLTETTGSNTIKWRFGNGSYCHFSDCSGTGIEYGCNFLINKDYSISLIQMT